MSNGYTRKALVSALVTFVIIAGTGAAAWSIGVFRAYQSEHAKERIEKAQNDQSGWDHGVICTTVPSREYTVRLECLPNAPKAEDYSDGSEYDLKAQQDMAEWTLGVLFISIAALLATIVGVVFVWLTLRENRRIGQREVRAYVGVSAAKLTGEGTAGRNINVQFMNSGNSPAYKASLKIVAKPMSNAQEIDMDDPKPFAMPVLGPGQKYTHTKAFGFGVLASILVECAKEDISLHIFGVLYYEDAFDAPRETHFRMFIEDLARDGDFLFCRDGNNAT